MNSCDFLELVKDVICIEGRDLSMSDAFREYEEWTSLTFLSIVAMIDEEFDILFETSDFAGFITWDDVLSAIQSELSNQGN